jgi:hypothetical protein
VFVGYNIVECDVARGQLFCPGCWYYIQRILTVHQLKLPSGTHTNLYVTKVGYILTTDYVLQNIIILTFCINVTSLCRNL